MSRDVFLARYPVSAGDLLFSPLVFREGLEALAEAPRPHPAGLRRLASWAGVEGSAFRMALSRLQQRGMLRRQADRGGVERLLPGEAASAIREAVVRRASRPPGFTLVVFSFASADARPRQLVRETLRLHGFQKLAQNVYVNGRVDTAPLEAVFAREGLRPHVFTFRVAEAEDPAVLARVAAAFDLEGRRRVLLRLEEDLRRWLGAPRLDDQAWVHRALYAGPVHYRLTYVDEPPLPEAVHPEGYPLRRVEALLGELLAARPRAFPAYYQEVFA